jgi:hypothetical protein
MLSRQFKLFFIGAIAAISLIAVPAAASATVYYEDVTCVTASDCFAAASTDSDGFARVARWNGSQWTVQTVPHPSTATGTYLTGIACQSATYCWAVGGYSTATRSQRVYSVRWNGSAWSNQTAFEPSGSTSSTLNAVSCLPTGTKCVAVGRYGDASGIHSLGLTSPGQFGFAWTLATVPGNGSYYTELRGVSCTTSSFCVAIGELGDDVHAAIVAFNGDNATWTQESSTANPSGLDSTLDVFDVSCRSYSDCSAVGGSLSWVADNPGFHSVYRPYAIKRGSVGFNWTDGYPVSGSSTMTNAALTGVSCPASTCVAVGYNGSSPLLLRVVNGSYVHSSVDELPGGGTPALTSVSCISASECMGVGGAQAYRFNGTNWVSAP